MKKGIIILCALAILALFLISCSGDKGYKVTYSYNDGAGEKILETVFTSQSGNYLAPIERSGYSFLGYFSPDGIQYFDETGYQIPSMIIDRNISLSAVYEGERYYITYNSLGGTLEGDLKKNQVTYHYGDVIYEFPYAISGDENYEFDGWFSEDEKVRYSYGTTPVKNLMVKEYMPKTGLVHYGNMYARFKAKEVTVTINYSDGYTPNDEIKLKTGSYLDLTKYYKTEENREIVSFSTMAGFDVSVPEYVNGDITVYAVWKSFKNVTFVYSEGDEVTKKIYEELGKSTYLLDEGRPGYKLIGWHTASNLSGNPMTYALYGALKDKYYANLKADSYTVTFNAEKKLDKITYSYGSEIALPVVSKDGYTFVGWAESENSHSSFLVIDKSMWGDKTLYPQFVKADSKATVSYTGTDITIRNQYYTIGENLTLPKIDFDESIDSEGKANLFQGWYNKSNNKRVYEGDIVSSNMELVAKFAKSTPISSAEDFLKIKDNREGNYHLTCDINFKFEAINGFDTFKGIFDGRGYKLYNLVINGTDDNIFGLFTQNTGTIKNLTLENTSARLDNVLRVYTVAGILTGYNYGTIENCHIKDSSIDISVVDGATFGTISARSEGSIVSCSTEATIKGKIKLIGYYESSNGSLSVPSGGIPTSHIGGFVGYGAGEIKNSYANCQMDITLLAEKAVHKANIGGFIGMSGANSRLVCQDSYSKGKINVAMDEGKELIYYTLGGFVGLLFDGDISKCYTDNFELDGAYAIYSDEKGQHENAGGAFAGVVSVGGTINNCYARVNAELKRGTAGLAGVVQGKIAYSFAYCDTLINAYSIKGGFANSVEKNATIQNCFTTYYSFLEADGGFITNCYSVKESDKDTSSDKVSISEMRSSSFIFDKVFFDKDIWVFENLPKLK